MSDAETESPTACMLIIGNEILSGRTQDANLAYLARSLGEIGISIKEARVIPDEKEVIVSVVNECRANYTYVFTTGGIGPTHDDITAECVAAAYDVPLEQHPDAYKALFDPDVPKEIMEARLLMARVPKGGTLIENKVSRAPGFKMGNVYVMAGVPMVMQAMVEAILPTLKQGIPIMSKTIGAYLGESQVSKPLADIQGRYPFVDIGSYPFYREKGYGTNLVIRGKDEEELELVAEELRQMIRANGKEPVEGEI